MKRAIIIVDHGSVRPAANEMLEGLVLQVQQLTTDRVYTAHMELAEPNIAQAFDAAVRDGADFVFVFPYFLAPGRHSREDIPRLCAEAAARHAGVRWHCSGPIGLDPMLAQLVIHRIRRCDQFDYICDECPDPDLCNPLMGRDDD